jgi:hypothetical protein
MKKEKDDSDEKKEHKKSEILQIGERVLNEQKNVKECQKMFTN